MKKHLIFLFLALFISFLSISSSQNDTNESIICGDNICDLNETISCPSDCDECTGALNCIDSDLCTTDTCEGSPKKCVNTLIVCDDNNPSTTDECVEGECLYIKTSECKSGDNYCPAGCTIETDLDCPEEDECSYNHNCDDNNPCTKDLCEGKPKKCTHLSDDGNREDPQQYCIGGRLEDQKEEGVYCNEDYECISNICSNDQCVEHKPSWLETNIPWLYNILKFFGLI